MSIVSGLAPTSNRSGRQKIMETVIMMMAQPMLSTSAF